jgi:copper chaperone
MNRISIGVGGMTCMGCVNSIKRVLTALPGVKEVDVSLEHARAEVAYDEAAVKIDDLRAAIEDAGFEAR